ARRYQDARQDKQIWLENSRECALRAGTEKAPYKLRYYFGDWRDDLTLMFGRATQRYSFLEKNRLGLKDPDGTLLYRADGREFQTAQRVQLMLQDVNSFFAERKRYPKSLDDLGVDWSFKNPF